MMTFYFTMGIFWVELAILVEFAAILLQARRFHLVLVGLGILTMISYWIIGSRALALFLSTLPGNAAF